MSRTKTVALEEGLEDIREYLQDKGFQVVDWGKDQLVVDALVYKNRSLSEIQIEHVTSAVPVNFAVNNSTGVLLVNAQNKTPEEVYEIIKNRVYDHFL